MGQHASSRFTATLATCRLAQNHRDDLYLQAALEQVGIPTAIELWDSSEYDWGKPSLVLIRSTWDYVKDISHFFAWASSINRKTLLMNPLHVLQWNSNKRYLLNVERAGGPIIPTIWLSRLQRDEAPAIIGTALRKWSTIVMKPCIGAGSVGFSRIHFLDEGLAHLDTLLPTGEVMIQPYVQSFQEEGEYSLIFIGRIFSHAVRKFALDLPVQKVPTGNGTRVEAIEVLPKEVQKVATHIMEAMRCTHVFTRIDVISYQGRACINEVELIEPQLFLGTAPHAALEAARAIRDYLVCNQENLHFSRDLTRCV
jgi:glutathione synthase/RimK-type ligase-like ATP-grasp enzyme